MDYNKSRQKKIAVINDLSGYGRCSLTVAIPVISAMRIQCCPVPTAILSNHTGFDNYFFDDYTRHMSPYIDEWEKLGLKFDGILTGFLGSSQQLELVNDFIDRFSDENTKVIVDPIMGDDGKIYGTYTEDMCRKMRSLAARADILTPNLTEACILTDTKYLPKDQRHSDSKYMSEDTSLHHLEELAAKLAAQGKPGCRVAITGITQKSYIANMVYEEDKACMEDMKGKSGEKTAGYKSHICRCHRVGEQRPGTGDIFSAIIAADAVNGVDFLSSVKKATRFIKRSLEVSAELEIPAQNGVAFEELLCRLH